MKRDKQVVGIGKPGDFADAHARIGHLWCKIAYILIVQEDFNCGMRHPGPPIGGLNAWLVDLAAGWQPLSVYRSFYPRRQALHAGVFGLGCQYERLGNGQKKQNSETKHNFCVKGSAPDNPRLVIE